MGDLLMSKGGQQDLKDVLRMKSTGIDTDHFNKWQRFKKGWSAVDRAQWLSLLKRLRKMPDGAVELYPPLSDEEKLWARSLLERADALELYGEHMYKIFNTEHHKDITE
jgi:hypothetical protein